MSLSRPGGLLGPSKQAPWSKLLIKVSGNGEGLLVSADGERINKVQVTIQSGFFPKLSKNVVPVLSRLPQTQEKGACYTTLSEKSRISNGI